MALATEATEREIEARVKEAMDLVSIVARQVRRHVGGRMEIGDLESFGSEGLLRAAKSFDPGRGVPFRKWASLRIRGAIIDGVRNGGTLSRHAYARLRAMEAADFVQEGRLEDDATSPPKDAQAADKRIDDALSGMAMAMASAFLTASSDGLDTASDERGLDPEQATAEKQLVDRVRAAIARLPDPSGALLDKHYFEGLTFDEAAKQLGLSKSWASRLHARAMEALVEELRGLG